MQNTKVQIWRTILWIQRLYLVMLKVKLGSSSSSVWLAMILIGALPAMSYALRAATRREGQSNIVVAQQISPTIWNLAIQVLPKWSDANFLLLKKVSLFQRIDFLAKGSTFAYSYHLDCLETILAHLTRRQSFSGKFHSIFYNICDLVVLRIIIKSSSRCRFWNRLRKIGMESVWKKSCANIFTPEEHLTRMIRFFAQWYLFCQT